MTTSPVHQPIEPDALLARWALGLSQFGLINGLILGYINQTGLTTSFHIALVVFLLAISLMRGAVQGIAATAQLLAIINLCAFAGLTVLFLVAGDYPSWTPAAVSLSITLLGLWLYRLQRWLLIACLSCLIVCVEIAAFWAVDQPTTLAILTLAGIVLLRRPTRLIIGTAATLVLSLVIPRIQAIDELVVCGIGCWSIFQLIKPMTLASISLGARRGISFVVFSVMMLTTIEDGRYVQRSLFNSAIDRHPNISQLVATTEEHWPDSHMELFCVPISNASDRYIVSPHGRENIAWVSPKTDGGNASPLPIMGEAPDHSIQLPDHWLLVDAGDGAMKSIRVTDQTTTVIHAKATATNVQHMNKHAASNRILITHDLEDFCDVFDTSGTRILRIDALAGGDGTGSECSELADGRIVFTYRYDYFYTMVHVVSPTGIARPKTHKIFNPSFFHQHEIHTKADGELILIPRMLFGDVIALNALGLEKIAQFPAVIGLRGVLSTTTVPECSDAKPAIYAWSYGSGLVAELSDDQSAPTKSWDIGPLVRTVNMDCDCSRLLAASSEGGFAITP